MAVKQTILIVDDEPAIRDMLAMNLKSSYDVLLAADGIEAVQVYKRNAEHIAAIITDLDMPRLSGQLLTEWIHHINSQLPVIVMSGSIKKVDSDELLRNSSVALLSKPFNTIELRALLIHVLGKSREAPPERINQMSLNEESCN